jgi:hypothetical protein
MFLVILTPLENFELKSEKSSPKKCVLVKNHLGLLKSSHPKTHLQNQPIIDFL